MGAWQLAVVGAGSMAAAVLLFIVASRLSTRPYTEEARGAGLAYATWWLLAATVLANDALRTWLGLIGSDLTSVHLALAYLKVFVIAGALFALAYYVAYVWTGHHRHRWWIAGLAAAYAAFWAWTLTDSLPAEVVVMEWSTRLTTSTTLGPAFRTWGAAAFYLPVLGLAVAYLALWHRLTDHMQRWRIVAVGISLLTFFVAGSIEFSPDTQANQPWFILFPLAKLLAAVLVFVVYRKPASMHGRVVL